MKMTVWKYGIALLSVLLFFSIFGCGTPVAETAKTEEPLPVHQEKPLPVHQEEPIELRIPYDYTWDETAEEVAATVERLGLIGGELHEDGAVTYLLQGEE